MRARSRIAKVPQFNRVKVSNGPPPRPIKIATHLNVALDMRDTLGRSARCTSDHPPRRKADHGLQRGNAPLRIVRIAARENHRVGAIDVPEFGG